MWGEASLSFSQWILDILYDIQVPRYESCIVAEGWVHRLPENQFKAILNSKEWWLWKNYLFTVPSLPLCILSVLATPPNSCALHIVPHSEASIVMWNL